MIQNNKLLCLAIGAAMCVICSLQAAAAAFGGRDGNQPPHRSAAAAAADSRRWNYDQMADEFLHKQRVPGQQFSVKTVKVDAEARFRALPGARPNNLMGYLAFKELGGGKAIDANLVPVYAELTSRIRALMPPTKENMAAAASRPGASLPAAAGAPYTAGELEQVHIALAALPREGRTPEEAVSAIGALCPGIEPAKIAMILATMEEHH